MLTIRDIPEPLNAEFKDAMAAGFAERNKMWKNQPSPVREEIYRQAFQDGIRASLKILPVLLKAAETDSGFDVHHPEAAPKCAHGIPTSARCTKCDHDASEKAYIDSLQPDARNEPPHIERERAVVKNLQAKGLVPYPRWKLNASVVCDDESTYPEGTVFCLLEDEKSYCKLEEVYGANRTLMILKGTPSGRAMLDKFSIC